MKKYGILGGSFNPIHLGHLILAQEALYAFDLDKVLFIPTTDNPLKKKKNQVSKYDRYEMASLAIADNHHFEISDIELKNTGYSYTIDTIRQLQGKDENVKYYFICGADIIFHLQRWKEFEELFRCMSFIAAYRKGYDKEKLYCEIEKLTKLYGADIITLKAPLIDISSTLIRNRIKDNGSVKYMLHDKVYEYIQKEGFYKE
jgi:nicotinate-nucleotide adenylyltransferase